MCRPDCTHGTPRKNKPGHSKMNDLIKKSIEKDKPPPPKPSK